MSDTNTRAVRYDNDSSRIQRGDEIVAMALRLGNGRWGLYDREERKLTNSTFANLSDVAPAFDRIEGKGS